MRADYLSEAFRVAQAACEMPDVTVVLGDCRWNVHSKLLTSKSDYFTKALQEPDEVRRHPLAQCVIDIRRKQRQTP